MPQPDLLIPYLKCILYFSYCFPSISCSPLVQDFIISDLDHCRSLSLVLHSHSCPSPQQSSPHTTAWFIFLNLNYRFDSDFSCLKPFNGILLHIKLNPNSISWPTRPSILILAHLSNFIPILTPHSWISLEYRTSQTFFTSQGLVLAVLLGFSWSS